MTEPPPILVTGAGAGIGQAIAICLAQAGHPVACLDINPDTAAQTARSIKQLGSNPPQPDATQTYPTKPYQAKPYQADVSDPKQCEAAFARIVKDFPDLGAIVNNAGVILRAPLLQTTPQEFAHVLATNLGGAFHFTQLAAAYWTTRQQPGHIVNISSGHATIGGYDRVAYAASKAAIEALTRNAAVELGQHGILVNAVSPGFTFTEMSRQSLVGERLAMVERRLPIRRVAEAEEVAQAVLALVSGKIPYMTGQTLRVDGGWSASDVDYSRLKPEQNQPKQH